MTVPFSEAASDMVATNPATALRIRAASDVRMFRRLARAAREDGLPHAELRAANARVAARRVLDHARSISLLCALASREDRPSEMAG